jgi:hypothetical protein
VSQSILEFEKKEKLKNINDLVGDEHVLSEIDEKWEQAAKLANAEKSVLSNPDSVIENEKLQRELEN